jgi:hypothetical protein
MKAIETSAAAVDRVSEVQLYGTFIVRENKTA